MNKLSNLPNVILTPHIDGSTEEAEKIINEKVSDTLTSYINRSNSIGAINFPQIELKSNACHIKSTERPMDNNTNLVRVLYIHKNKPEILKTINSILRKYNIKKQYYEFTSLIAYPVTDVMTRSLFRDNIHI